MHPVLIDFGFFKLHTYGACMALGFLISWKLVERISRRKDLADLIMYLLAGGVVGSRIAYVIEHWTSEFAANPVMVFRVDKGGLVFYGGLILSMLIFFVWCVLKKERPLALADLLCVVVPLGHAFGRIGCFFYGCCWGRISDSPLAVSFPRHSPAWYDQLSHGLIDQTASASLPVLPTQLLEASALFVLFAILIAIYLKWRRHTAGVYLIGYAALRFGMEYLRGDPRAAVLGLSIGQTISLGMAFAGAAFVVMGLRRNRSDKVAP